METMRGAVEETTAAMPQWLDPEVVFTRPMSSVDSDRVKASEAAASVLIARVYATPNHADDGQESCIAADLDVTAAGDNDTPRRRRRRRRRRQSPVVAVSSLDKELSDIQTRFVLLSYLQSLMAID